MLWTSVSHCSYEVNWNMDKEVVDSLSGEAHLKFLSQQVATQGDPHSTMKGNLKKRPGGYDKENTALLNLKLCKNLHVVAAKYMMMPIKFGVLR